MVQAVGIRQGSHRCGGWAEMRRGCPRALPHRPAQVRLPRAGLARRRSNRVGGEGPRGRPLPSLSFSTLTFGWDWGGQQGQALSWAFTEGWPASFLILAPPLSGSLSETGEKVFDKQVPFGFKMIRNNVTLHLGG